MVFEDFHELQELISNLVARYRNPSSDSDVGHKLVGTVREDEPHCGEYLIDAIIMTTPVGKVIAPGGKLTNNEVEIKAVMHTSY